MLEEKLDKLKDIWTSIEIIDGKYVVSAKFPENYNVYDSEDKAIKVIDDTAGETRKFWYVAQVDSISINDIIDFINATVNANIEAIKRVVLYESKIKELQELFNNDKMSYNDLEKLSFDFKPKPKSKEITQRPTLKMSKPKKNDEKENKVESSYTSNEELGVDTTVIEDGNAVKVVSKTETETNTNGEFVNGVNVAELRGE